MVGAPTWKWEWNLNTLVILVGFASGIGVWGATWQKLNDASVRNGDAIERLDTRVTAIEAAGRLLDTHNLRISSLERQASDAVSSMRTVETTLSGLTTDVRVVKEILQRLEASQNGRRPLQE